MLVGVSEFNWYDLHNCICDSGYYLIGKLSPQILHSILCCSYTLCLDYVDNSNLALSNLRVNTDTQHHIIFEP